ncbi:MAG: DNA polymerase IV, partial [Planctomycetota bacterium]|nr:DNA polymerase IV [Planctomycetota bacterium]
VIAAASYEAREFGVHSAMPTAQALKLCPDLVLLQADFDKYTQVSQQIMGIFHRYTPLVEPLSLDEAFLDVTGCERLHGDGIAVGRAIKKDVLKETGLVASIGVAPSKFLAKLASDLDKPDGFRVIRRDEIRQVLDPLPVSKIFGVGPRTAKRLESLGVRTVSDLASRDRSEVLREFGASGAWIHDLAQGIDSRRVSPNRPEKSHGMERTFPEDVDDREELRLYLFEFCEEVAYDLRHRGLRGRTITVKARFWNFKTVTRSRTLDVPTNIGPRIYSVARSLLERIPPGPLRLLGVSVSGLEDVREPLQSSLFDEVRAERPAADDARHERTSRAMDKLRRKYGRRAVVPASLLGRSTEGRDGSGGPGGSPGRPAQG